MGISATPNARSSRITSGHASLLKLASRSFNNILDVLFDVRNADSHLRGKNVAEAGVRFAASFLLLVVAHDQLDKFSGVDVRISRALDVLNDLLGQMCR